MRPDMAKQIVERERGGHRDGESTSRHVRRTSRHLLRCGLEEFEAGCGIKAHIGRWKGRGFGSGQGKYGRKQLNENLNPLYRYLNSQVGRPWNKVFAEICEKIKLDSTVQRHIREHVFDRVETNIRIINGVPHEFNPSSRYGRYNTEPGEVWIPHVSWRTRTGSSREMYVDPRDGLLKFTPKAKPAAWQIASQKSKEEEARSRYFPKDNPLVRYYKIDGIWYEIRYRRLNDEEKKVGRAGRWGTHYNSVTQKTVRRWEEEHYPSCISEKILPYKGFHPLSKHQVNSKEVRRIEAAIAKEFKHIRRAA